MHVVIFTGGELIKSQLVTDAIQSADLILAADSGGCKAVAFGILPKAVIGDFDSLDAKTKHQLKQRQVVLKISPSEKDETDTELAIEFAIEKSATEITLLGGISGDRIDHILANLLYAVISSVPITFINGQQKSFVAKGPTTFDMLGKTNDLLSLIPLQGDVKGLKSNGLKWELDDSVLVFGKPRGVSNVFLQETVSLSFTSGILFVTHTLPEQK